MDANTIVSVGQFALQNSALLALLLFLSISLLIWRRTRSTHMLLARLWTLFNGKTECSDPNIKDFLSAQTAVMQFRFMTGLPARTLQHAKSLCSWAGQRDEDIGDIVACGKYFDLTVPDLKPSSKLPKVWHLVCLTGLVALLVMTTYGLIAGAVYDRAILRIKASGTWLTVAGGYAIPLYEGAGFKLQQCQPESAALAAKSGFEKADIDTLCASLSDPHLDAYTASTLLAQRIAFLFAALVSLCLAWAMGQWLYQGVKAREMRLRLDDPDRVYTPENPCKTDSNSASSPCPDHPAPVTEHRPDEQ